MAKEEKLPKSKESILIKQLKEDTKLGKDQKMEYICIANQYLEKFDEYINKTSIDMNKEIPLGIDVWRDFLNYPVVRRYIQSFKDEQIEQIADKGLMEGDKNAVSIIIINQNNSVLVNDFATLCNDRNFSSPLIKCLFLQMLAPNNLNVKQSAKHTQK